ncbi:MAG: SCP2 sterol-binding domain-containing protein [Gammaproteobacteria bacterium]|nr:SCP2 sterol-binding domain-containing protein [Gammaproteobacteria bacterium]
MLSLLEEVVLIKISKVLNELLYNNIINNKITKLDNKVIKVILHKSFVNPEYFISFNNNIIKISNNTPLNPVDLTIKLTLNGLLKSGFSSPEAAIRDSSIEFFGNLNLAMDLQALLNNADIKNNTKTNIKELLQERLAQVTSVSFAYQVIKILDMICERIDLKSNELREQITDYLETESGLVVNKYELDDFCNNIDILRDNVARLRARWEMIDKQQN